jgi:hypothetical protein
MNLVTLRVEGTEEALASLRGALRLEADATWKKGEPTRRGGYHSSAGFNTTIADASNPDEMIVAIRNFFAMCKEQGVTFVRPSLSAELSVGVTVGDSDQFVASVALSASDILLLGSLGIALSVTAYPTSDEANAIDQPA